MAGRTQRQAPERATAAGPVAVGDHVRLDADGPVGEVLALDGGEALLALGCAPEPRRGRRG